MRLIFETVPSISRKSIPRVRNDIMLRKGARLEEKDLLEEVEEEEQE